MLKRLLEMKLVDYVAMDIKSTLDERYSVAVGRRIHRARRVQNTSPGTEKAESRNQSAETRESGLSDFWSLISDFSFVTVLLPVVL